MFPSSPCLVRKKYAHTEARGKRRAVCRAGRGFSDPSGPWQPSLQVEVSGGRRGLRRCPAGSNGGARRAYSAPRDAADGVVRTAPSPVSGCLQRNRRLLTWPAERDRTVAACYTRFAHRPHDQSCEEQENGMTLRTTGVERYRTDVPLAGGRLHESSRLRCDCGRPAATFAMPSATNSRLRSTGTPLRSS